MQKQKRLAGRRIRKARRDQRRRYERIAKATKWQAKRARRLGRALAGLGAAATGASVAAQKFGDALSHLTPGESPGESSLATMAQGSDQEESH